MTAGEEPRTDVVVAGAGAAGLAAALSAAEAGLRVLVVEAREMFREDCNTAMSTSMVPAAGTQAQHAAGIEDSPELFYEDIARKTDGEADRDAAAALTDVSAELVDWLSTRCGVPLELVTDVHYPGHSRNRCHAVPDRAGRTLHGSLIRAVRDARSVELIVPMRLVDVTLDADGVIAAASVESPGGSQEQVKASAVVLATNGFGADPVLVRTYVPEMAEALYFGGAGSTGDALRIGERIDADLAYLDAYQGHGSVASPHGVLLTWTAMMHGGILVNALGERFGDESIGYSEFARLVLAQPDGIAWAVFDEQIDAQCRAFDDHRRCAESGAVLRAVDVTQLAATTGIPEERLAETLKDARASAEGAVDPFGRSDWERPLRSPYCTVRVTGALFHTQGGLRTNGSASVLREGNPIPGLYAAGGAAAGISGHGADGYLAGNGLLSALGLGYLAGRHIPRSLA